MTRNLLTCPLHRIGETAAQQAQEKLELKQRKQRVGELEQLIRREAEALEAGSSCRRPALTGSQSGSLILQHAELNRKTQHAELADRLMRECEAMETEIAMLKNKRSPSEVRELRSLGEDRSSLNRDFAYCSA